MSQKTPRATTPVKLLNLLDIEYGVSLRAESDATAVRIARELSEGMTQAERIATREFLGSAGTGSGGMHHQPFGRLAVIKHTVIANHDLNCQHIE